MLHYCPHCSDSICAKAIVCRAKSGERCPRCGHLTDMIDSRKKGFQGARAAKTTFVSLVLTRMRWPHSPAQNAIYARLSPSACKSFLRK